jgi:hypothetical protein
MIQYNNIVQDYFFENFKGGGGKGGSSRSGKKNDNDIFNRYFSNILIVLVIFSFIKFITILFPKMKIL